MARKPETRIVPGAAPPPPALHPNEIAARATDGNISGFEGLTPLDEAESSIARVLSEIGADDESESKVQVYRIMKDTRQSAFICEMLPSEFSLARIAEDCGGGVFNIKVYVPQYEEGVKTGRVKLAANPRILIEGQPRVYRRPDPEPDPAPAPAPVAREDPMLALIREMRESNERILTALTSRPSLKDQILEMAELRRALAPEQPPRDAFAEFERFMALYEKLRPPLSDVPTNGSDLQMLLGLGREFFRMFTNAQANAGAPAEPLQIGNEPAPAPAPAPAPSANPAPAAPAQSVETDPVKIFYIAFVKQLATAARQNDEIEKFAQAIVKQAPDDFITMLQEKTDAEALAWLAQYHADVNLFPDWFKRLKARILEMVATGANDESVPGA